MRRISCSGILLEDLSGGFVRINRVLYRQIQLGRGDKFFGLFLVFANNIRYYRLYGSVDLIVAGADCQYDFFAFGKLFVWLNTLPYNRTRSIVACLLFKFYDIT